MTFHVTVCGPGLVTMTTPNPSSPSIISVPDSCWEELLVFVTPALFIVIFGMIRLRQLADFPRVLAPSSWRHAVKVFVTIAIVVMVIIAGFIHLVTNTASIILSVSVSFTILGWLFSLSLLVLEQSRVLPHDFVLRGWWLSEFIAFNIKVFSVIKYVNMHGLSSDFFIYIINYTLLCIMAIFAFVPSDSSRLPSIPVPLQSRGEHDETSLSLTPSAKSSSSDSNYSYSPSSLNELVHIIKHAHKTGHKLRVGGYNKKRSKNKINNKNDKIYHANKNTKSEQCYYLSLEKLNKVSFVDKRLLRVRVESGIKLNQLGEVLREFGMQLPSAPISYQSLGGAVAMAAHGCGVNHGTLCSFITAMDVVLANGELCHVAAADDMTADNNDGRNRRYSQDGEGDGGENSDLLPAFRVSLGQLGVIYSVTLQCERYTYVKSVEKTINFDYVLTNLNETLGSNDYVILSWLPYTDVFMMRSATKIEQTTSSGGRFRMWWEGIATGFVVRWFQSVGRLMPRMVPPLNQFYVRRIVPSGTKFEPMESFLTSRLGWTTSDSATMSVEYAVAKSDARAVLTEIRRYVLQKQSDRGGGFILTKPVVITFADTESNYLSPNSGRKTCYIYMSIPNKKEWSLHFVNGLEDLICRFGGRPCWSNYAWHNEADGGVDPTSSPSSPLHDFEFLSFRYPDLDTFIEIRQRLDPKRIFCNHPALACMQTISP